MASLRYNNDTLKDNIAGWSSSVARRAHNPKAVGSNPAPATKSPLISQEISGFPCFPNLLRMFFRGEFGVTQTLTHTGVKPVFIVWDFHFDVILQ